jgi:hypothetical protein
MQEQPQNLNDTSDDTEATLVTPRFDAEEARRAHPVVPLAEAREPVVNHPRARRGVRRTWPPALLAIALLVGVAVGGGVASKVLRRTQPTPDAAQTPAAVAPAQASEAPVLPETSPPVEAALEVADTKPEPRATRARRAEAERVPAQAEAVRIDDEDFGDDDEGRRDRGRGKHRKHGGDDGEKEMRQIVKDAKKKVPRLVDVLVKP